MARSTPVRRTEMAHGSKSVESLLEALRRLWKSIEVESPPELQSQLKREIEETISRLKWRIEKSLRATRPTFKERLLFETVDEPGTAPLAATEEPAKPRFPQAVIRIYDKDLVEHALAHVPEAIKFSDIQAFREHLIGKIRCNSLATRRRIAGYLLNRFFPGDVLHKDLAEFAFQTAGKPALSEALFYLTCRMEPIVASVANGVVFPSLPEGGVARGRVKEFVQSQFPESRSVSDMSQAIIRTFERFGIGSATTTRLNVSLREGSLAAFGYVLHLEFPEPGMYSFERLLNGPMHRWLLWDQQWMSRQLYSLREAGLLSKVSEIDRLRQFTTKYTLAEAVQPIVALAKESPP